MKEHADIEIEQNLARLLGRLSDARLQLLIHEARSYLVKARKVLLSSIDAGDREGLAREAHKVRGAMLIYGNTRLESLLGKLSDVSSETGFIDTALVNELNREFERIDRVLSTFE